MTIKKTCQRHVWHLTFQKAQSFAVQLAASVSRHRKKKKKYHSPVTLTAADDLVSLASVGSYMDRAGEIVLQPKLPGLPSASGSTDTWKHPTTGSLQIASLSCTPPPETCSCSRAKSCGYTMSAHAATSHGNITAKTTARHRAPAWAQLGEVVL